MTDSLRRHELRAALGVSGETLRRYIRDRKLPPPDIDLGPKAQWWHRATLEAAGIRLPQATPPTPASS